MKWIRRAVDGDWWLCLKAPSGRVYMIQRKGRVGDCIHW